MIQHIVPVGYLTARQIGEEAGITPKTVHYRAAMLGIAGVTVSPWRGSPVVVLRVYAACDVPALVARRPRQPAAVRPVSNGPTREHIKQKHWSVVETVARCYEITPSELVSGGRDPLLVEARRIAVQLLADRGLGPTHIGYVVDLDHSTVLHHLSVLRDKPTEEERVMLTDCCKAVQQIGAS